MLVMFAFLSNIGKSKIMFYEGDGVYIIYRKIHA